MKTSLNRQDGGVAILFFLILCFSVALGQPNDVIHALSIKPSYGMSVGAKSPKSDNYLYGIQLSYDRSLLDKQAEWITFLRAKSIRFSLLLHNMNAMKEQVEDQAYPYGLAFGLVSQLDFRVAQLGKAQLLFSPGLGLGYVTETSRTNPGTSILSSHLNLAVVGDLTLEAPVNDRLSVLAGVGMMHYSNGGIKIPNGGINTLNGSLGLKTVLHRKPSSAIDRLNFYHKEGSSWEFALGMGVRGKYRSSDNFWRTGLYGGYNYFINHTLGFRAGLDMVYYHTVFDDNRFEETFQYYGSSYDRVRWGLSVGSELAMGRFGLLGQVGYYFHYKSYHQVKWYWLFAPKFYITRNFGVQTSLYLHNAQADYLNCGLFFTI